jgi:hypothetical protein
MSFASKLKTADARTLASVAFYAAVGIVLLSLLPLANFPPHIGLTGILSLVTAYGLLKKRYWALWLVIALLAASTTICLYTLYVFAFTNVIVGLSMIIYAILTWLFTLYIVSKKN